MISFMFNQHFSRVTFVNCGGCSFNGWMPLLLYDHQTATKH